MSNHALLTLTNVTCRFGGLTAVDNVSFALHGGEILGLIGPNGAGKTTLVNLISGSIRPPTEGRIVFQNHDVSNMPAYQRARLGIARTYQIMKPFPGLSVLDNVAVGSLFGHAKSHTHLKIAREKALECLSFVGLDAYANQKAEDLGGPDRKRLELAKAIAMEPVLLLCDEVMAGLNLVEINDVIELLRKIRAQGITILVIEHVMKAIQSLSDRLLVLNHGQQIAHGPPKDVLADPKVIEAYLGKRREHVHEQE